MVSDRSLDVDDGLEQKRARLMLDEEDARRMRCRVQPSTAPKQRFEGDASQMVAADAERRERRARIL